MNPIKPRGPWATRQTLAQSDDLAGDLSIMAQLEGKPIPTVQEMADLLNVSRTTAYRCMTRLKRRGMLKLIDRVLLPPGVCQCIVDLRAQLTDKAAVSRLEARLRSDPFVSTAAAVTGRYSYRLNSLHKNASTANAWFRALLSEPAVIDGALIFCRTIIDRPSYAQALLGDPVDVARG